MIQELFAKKNERKNDTGGVGERLERDRIESSTNGEKMRGGGGGTEKEEM